MCIRKFSLIILVILLYGSIIDVLAQKRPQEEFDYYKSKYPNEPAVFTKKSERVSYSIVNDTIVTTIRIYRELLHLGENTVRYATDQVYTSSFSEVKDLIAYTLIPGKKKYDKVEVSDFTESFDKEDYVFYDDSKDISYTYPAVQKGVKTVIEYTRTIRDARMMNLFFFDSYAPIDEAVYSVEFDNRITVTPQFFNGIKDEIKIEDIEVNSERKKKVFTALNRSRIKFDHSSPSFSYLAGSIYCPITSYVSSNGETKKVISDTDELHNWYRTFISNIQERDDNIKTLVESIVEPDDDVLEKVRKIYYWVQANIKYIAFEDSMRGLIPHPGNYVLDKRYGDCKDMASAIVSMLREADIDAQYTWIGSRELPYKYSETPSPVTDNHMIATIKHDGRIYYLDATGQYTPIDLPSSMIQGKECLISYNSNDYLVQEVPVVPKEKNVITDSVQIVIQDGIVQGKGKAEFTGYEKVFNTYNLIKTNQQSIDNFVEAKLVKGTNKFHIESFDVANVNDLSKPISIDYSFNIPDYYREISGNIYINLILDKSLTEALIEDRSIPIENDYKYMHKSVVSLELPDGYKVKTLPDDVVDSDENFGYNISYKEENGLLVVTKEIYVDYLLMQPEHFDSWNSIITSYSKASRKALILTKN